MKTWMIYWAGMIMSLPVLAGTVNPDSNLVAKPDSTMPFQVTFITPFGTNGMLSPTSTNYFSLNIIAGYNGGVEGFELGGFANVIEHDVRGTQVAGFANVVREDLSGIQVAGFSNLVNKQAEGLMIAGFTNHCSESAKVLQISGFSNQVMGSMKGGQLAGFSNICTDTALGVQLAGFGNFSSGHSQSVQMSGFMNVNRGDLDGAQIAGFANTAGNVEGVQISGFINNAHVVEGFQVGIINVADSFERGFPIGLISTVKNGYRSFSIGTNELLWVEGQYRMGVERFHNIFALSISPVPQQSGWSVGYGIGTQLLTRPKSSVGMDLMAFHVNEGEIWTDAYNQLVRLSGRYTYLPTAGRFGIWVAPSLNVQTSSRWRYNGSGFDSELAPYALLQDSGYNSKSRLWFGLQTGVSF